MTTLVTGGTGQLGTAFRCIVPGAVHPTRAELDLSRPAGVAQRLAAIAPDRIINCAAYTAVDRAEDQESEAHLVNADSVGVMAAVAARRSIPFVTYSSDYVFDGTGDRPYVESDPTRPVNAYGRTKLAGERLALEAHPGALVIRTSWVLSGTHANFIATILRLLRERSITVVDDQHGCPTMADDLAAATLAAMDAGATGILHLANTGATTWYRLARSAAEVAGLDPGLVEACTTAEYPLPAPRPAYSVLGTERRDELGIDPLPHWQDSLPRLVDGLLAAGLAG